MLDGLCNILYLKEFFVAVCCSILNKQGIGTNIKLQDDNQSNKKIRLEFVFLPNPVLLWWEVIDYSFWN